MNANVQMILVHSFRLHANLAPSHPPFPTSQPTSSYLNLTFNTPFHPSNALSTYSCA
jgi:hypothetical protein